MLATSDSKSFLRKEMNTEIVRLGKTHSSVLFK